MKPKFNSCLILNILFFSIVFISCNKSGFEFDKIKTNNLNAEWGLPLVKSTLTLKNFLNDTGNVIHTNADGLVYLVYESKNIVSEEAKDRTKIPDQHKILNQSFELPQLPSGLSFIVPLTFYFTFDLENQGQRIDSLFLTSGIYEIVLRTNLNKNVANVDLTVPNFISRDNGDTLKFSFDLSNPQGNEIVRSTSTNLSDYYVTFDSIQQNTIEINALVNIVTDDNDLSSYTISLENNFSQLKYSQFYGYIGVHSESYSDTIDLNLYNSVDAGSIIYGPESVKLNIEVENELGLPIQIETEKFTAYHTNGSHQDSSNIYLFGEGTLNNFSINSPGIGEIGKSAHTTISSENSNFTDVLNISPDKIIFDLNANFNYEGNNHTINFFTDTSEINIQATVSLDLFGSISSFKIIDTLDFSLGNVENLNAIEFKVDITNGFPINALAQVDFYDSEFNKLYSLFPEDDELILSAETGEAPDYKVITPTDKETIITINGEALDSILKATKIIFASTLSTESNKLVKIYSDYGVDLTMSAKLYINY